MEQFHPEFGYFHPTPHLRREWRVGLAAFVGGTAIGAVAMVAVSVSYRDVYKASAPAVATERAVAVHKPSRDTHAYPAKREPAAFENSNTEARPTEEQRPAQTAHANVEIYPTGPSPRESSPAKTTREPDLLPKPRPIGGPDALARNEESVPKEAGSVYARSNMHRRTVFWDWSR